MPRTHRTLPRLFVDQPLSAGGSVVLERDQSNYLINVLRRNAGDELVLFNGRDGAFLCAVDHPDKKKASLRIVEQSAPQTPPNDLWYGFAPLKSARLDYVVQKAVEMGVGAIQPVITQFTQVRKLKTDKLRANAIEAAEQCEVLNIPQIEDEIALDRLLADWPKLHGDRILCFADEEAASGSPIETIAAQKGKRVGLIVGPEGGFSEDERARLLALEFVIPISLGPRILRADTAAVAALALIQSIIGDWR